MKKTVSSVLVLLSFFFVVTSAQALEKLSTAELASHCKHYNKDPEGIDATFCVRYIQGFVDGAIATDEQVAQNAIRDAAKQETFLDRAIRTRLKRYPTYYAEFCLGEEVSLRNITQKIVHHLSVREILDENQGARETILHVLKKEYPCTTE